MRTTLSFLFLNFIFFSLEAQQTFSCSGNGFFTVSMATCNSNGTQPTDDDFLEFTVTSSVTNSSVPNFLGNFPVGTMVTSGPANCLSSGELELCCVEQNGGVISLEVPSDGCAVVLDLLWEFCQAETVTIAAEPVAPIPTLGQWGIILLGLILAIFGILSTRQEKGISLRKSQI